MNSISSPFTESSKDLICPITLQIFRDPVLAGDGHVYEREAIIRWIEENGISPLTRQPLTINELKSDDYLRKLAEQRRKSTVSYDARNEIVIFAPLQQPFSTNDSRALPVFEQFNTEYSSRFSRGCRKIFTPTVILIHMLVLIGVVVVIIIIAAKSGNSV